MNKYCRFTLSFLIYGALTVQAAHAIEQPAIEQPVSAAPAKPVVKAAATVVPVKVVPVQPVAATPAPEALRQPEHSPVQKISQSAADLAPVQTTPLQAPPTRLIHLDTANHLPEGTIQFTGGFQQTFFGGGIGKETYSVKVDWAPSDDLQINVAGELYDDPLARPTLGQDYNVTFATVGAAAKLRWYQQDKLSTSVLAGLYGMYLSAPLPTAVTANPNQRSTNLVGTLQFPITYTVNPQLQLHLSPGVVFSPKTIKGNPAYGTFFNIAAGVSWQPTDRLTLSASGSLPFAGSGGNVFRSSDGGIFRKLTWTAGLQYTFNPRFAAELYATNSFGATPVSSQLAFPPDGNDTLFGVNLKYLFDVGQNYPQTFRPRRPLTERDRQLWMDGLTLSSANTLPADVVRLRGSANTNSSYSANLSIGMTEDFQLELLFDTPAGYTLSPAARGGGDDVRFGAAAKLRLFDQNKGDLVSLAVKVGGSKDYTPRTGVGTLTVELPITYQANSSLAMFVTPKASFNGSAEPVGIGLGANYALSDRFQLIGEVTPVFKNSFRSVWSAGLRYSDIKSGFGADLYAGNAVYQQGIGSLSGDTRTYVGLNLHWTFGGNRF